MVMGKGGLDLLKSYEKCPTKNGLVTAYWDSVGKVYTIGWGHTGGVKQGQTETQKQADDMLKSDILKYATTVNQYVKKPMNQNQFDAFTDFCFNIGQDPQRGFPSSSAVKDFNLGNTKAVPNDMLKWNKAGGVYSQGVVNRRKAEIKLFNTASTATKVATPSANNANTDAVKDAQKKKDAKTASDKALANKKAIEDKKIADKKAQDILNKAKITKDAQKIKDAQTALDKQKATKAKTVPEDTKKASDSTTGNTSANKLVKSSISLIGVLSLIFLAKGYTEGKEML
jgi:lysozyme